MVQAAGEQVKAVAAIPAQFLAMLDTAHPSWRPVLEQGLAAVAMTDPAYLPALAVDEYLPTRGRLFAAFTQPLDAVGYVLVGEGPYPRAESATGICFMDGAVDALWSASGLSKPVNRATSLRNFMKMLLVADGVLEPGNTTGRAMAAVAEAAAAPDAPTIQTLNQLQKNLFDHGFLLMNAALVFRAHVAPVKDAEAWRPFLNTVLAALAAHAKAARRAPPTLVLWGKIAAVLESLAAHADFPKVVSEHPYNLSFIVNPAMQALFGPLHLLRPVR